MRAARPASTSSATSSARPGSSSARWQALPPGAAQASSTRMPAAAPRKRGASCAAASCTDTSPSAKPGNALTSVGSASRSASGANSQASAPRPGGLEARAISIARAAARVHPQPHRRLGIAGRGDRLPALGPVARKGVEHPGRVRVARREVLVRGREDRPALALEATQDRIDEAGCARAAERTRGLDGFRDGRVLGRRAMQQLVEADQQEAAQFRVLPAARAVEQPREAGFELEVPAHGAESDATASPAAARRPALPRRPRPRAAGRAPRRRRRRARRPRGSRRRPACSGEHLADERSRRSRARPQPTARRPGSCTRLSASAPSPAITTMPSAPADTIVPGHRARRGDTASASWIRSCAPSSVVSATGRGFNARTRRASAAASSRQSRRASALVSFAA